MGFCTENQGKVKDIPLAIRRNVYKFLKEIDFDEVDILLNKHSGCVVDGEDEILKIVMFDDTVVVFIKMNYYNKDTKKLSEDKILTFKIQRDEVEGLCK